MIYEFMQRVIIKNITKDTFTNIELSHDGTGNGEYRAKAKELNADEKREFSLYTLRANKPCNLILTYTYKGVSNTVIVYDKLSNNDLRLITIELNEADGEVIFNTIVNNDLW